MEAVGSPDVPGRAVLVVENTAGRPLTVLFRGPEAHAATIGTGSERRLLLHSGEYVELAYGGVDVRPYLGIISVDGRNYRQTFTIGALNGGD